MGRAIFVAIGLLALALGVSGFLAYQWVSGSGVSGVPEVSLDLGVTYLPVTPRSDLGVGSGNLVTAVAPNSLADRAGIKAGDVLLKFNGVALGQNTSLLGVMRTCVPGHKIVLEVWTQRTIKTIEFMH